MFRDSNIVQTFFRLNDPPDENEEVEVMRMYAQGLEDKCQELRMYAQGLEDKYQELRMYAQGLEDKCQELQDVVSCQKMEINRLNEKLLIVQVSLLCLSDWTTRLVKKEYLGTTLFNTMKWKNPKKPKFN